MLLNPEDPLNAIQNLAQQIYQKGLRELTGDVIIDDHLFESTVKRGMTLSPISLNENMIDLVLSASEAGEKATLTWRPQVPGYEVKNEVVTVAEMEALQLEVTADEARRHIIVKGTLPANQKNIVRTFPVQDPSFFARAGFIQALQKQGIKIQTTKSRVNIPPFSTQSRFTTRALDFSSPFGIWQAHFKSQSQPWCRSRSLITSFPPIQKNLR